MLSLVVVDAKRYDRFELRAMPVTLEAMEHADLDPPPPVLDSVGWSYLGGMGSFRWLFDYKH